ncbi:MAG: methyl-accepting chemotaxis protein, partial [Desulfonatronovibrio sp.]
MKNIKLGLKMGLGFGLLILIACVLGAMAVWNMSTAEKGAERMAAAYIPEVGAANELERNAQQVMYAVRGYGFTEENSYLEQGREGLAQLRSSLDEAANLAEAQSLPALEENSRTARDRVNEYEDLVDQTEAAIKRKNTDRENMDAAAAQFMESAATFLTSQNEAMKSEIDQESTIDALNERLEKITEINNVIDLGNSVRISAWRAQAERNPQAIEQGLEVFPKIQQILDTIESLTRMDVDLRQISAIREASDNYAGAMESLLSNWRDLDQLGNERTRVGEGVVDAAEQAAQAGMDQTQAIANSSVEDLGQASNIMVIGLVIALFLGILIAVILTKAITRPVAKGVAFSGEMAEGDLTSSLDIDQKDEIGVLAGAMQ